MDKIWVFLFILFINIAWCMEDTEESNLKVPQNGLRSSRARFPIFGSLFGSNDKKTTTKKPIENTFTESSTSSFGSGLWNYFKPSNVKESDKNKQNPITYTTISNSSVYQTDETSGNKSAIFNFENYTKINNSNDGYFSEGSVIYIVQNGTNANDNNGGTVIHTIQNQTNTDNVGSFANVFQSEGTYNKESQLSDYKNNKDNNKIQTSSDSVIPGPNAANYNLQNTKNSNTKNVVDKQAGRNVTSHKTPVMTDVENSKVSSTVITNTFSEGTYNQESQPSDYKNNKDNKIQTSSGSVISGQNIANSDFQKNSNSRNVTNHKTPVTTNIENSKVSSTINTNIFLGNNKTSATNTNTNYINYQNNKGGISKVQQESPPPSKITSVGHEVGPNALSSTYTKGPISSSSSSADTTNSHLVIVICTDPTTGSVIGKYESSSILEGYKDAMVDNDRTAEWATIGDNLSLPAQLIVRNISMIIRGKIHYCQIVNVEDGLTPQETSATQNPSMVVDVTYSSTKGNVPISQPSDQTSTNTNSKILNNPIVSTITAGMDFVSNIFSGGQGNNSSSSQITITNEVPSNLNINPNTDSSSSPDKKDTFTSSPPTESTYFESKIQVSTESSLNDNTASTSLTPNKGSSSSLDGPKTESSVLFESHLTSSKNKTKGDDAQLTDQGSKDSKEGDKKESLFISHHETTSEGSQETQKVSSHDLHISSYLGHKHSHKHDSNEKIYYSKKPYTSVHGDAPYYSMHTYHHSIEVDSKPVDSGEDSFSGVFVSKPIQLVKDTEEGKNEDMLIKLDDDDDDEISSDFEKINKEAKYAVFSFG